ncbi:MAG: hypothetical protein ACRD0Z_15690 [Acidimicrobiales bacterium]
MRSLSAGWRAESDDAVIAIRSWNVFSTHSPLVGQYTQLHSGYDLGPLLYWLLAIPVHLDPAHGALWGAAFWCVVAGVVAVEAAWSVSRWAGVGVALAVVWTTWWMPALAVNPIWNPYVGDIFFYLTICSAYATVRGRHRWWPVAVVAGSIATQSHLAFALGSVVLVVLSGAVVLRRALKAHSVDSALTGGLGAAGLCWIFPIVQEILGSPGNLTQLWTSQSTQAGMGLAFGLRGLAASVFPKPLWLFREPTTLVTAQIRSDSVAVAIIVGVLTLAIAAAAKAARKPALAYLAAFSLCSSACLVATYSSVASNKLITFQYIVVTTLPIGCLVWLTVLSAAAAAVSHLHLREGVPKRAPQRGRTGWSGRIGRLGPAPLGAVAALVAVSAVSQVREAETPNSMDSPSSIAFSQEATAKIEGLLPRGPVDLNVVQTKSLTTPLLSYGVLYGLAWQLQQDGWAPLVPPLGVLPPQYDAAAGEPSAQVRLSPHGITVHVHN